MSDAWRDELEGVVRNEDLSPAFSTHLTKYRSLMPSLALIFHLMEYVDNNEAAQVGPVSVEAAKRAAA